MVLSAEDVLATSVFLAGVVLLCMGCHYVYYHYCYPFDGWRHFWTDFLYYRSRFWTDFLYYRYLRKAYVIGAIGIVVAFYAAIYPVFGEPNGCLLMVMGLGYIVAGFWLDEYLFCHNVLFRGVIHHWTFLILGVALMIGGLVGLFLGLRIEDWMCIVVAIIVWIYAIVLILTQLAYVKHAGSYYFSHVSGKEFRKSVGAWGIAFIYGALLAVVFFWFGQNSEVARSVPDHITFSVSTAWIPSFGRIPLFGVYCCLVFTALMAHVVTVVSWWLWATSALFVPQTALEAWPEGGRKRAMWWGGFGIIVSAALPLFLFPKEGIELLSSVWLEGAAVLSDRWWVLLFYLNLLFAYLWALGPYLLAIVPTNKWLKDHPPHTDVIGVSRNVTGWSHEVRLIRYPCPVSNYLTGTGG